MASYVLYVQDDRDSAFKHFGVVIHDEAEAIANATGHQTLIFKDGEPWKLFDGFGTSYSIVLD
ncbi:MULTISPECIES: hypothetical protein [unclassified Bradyrhizobium]|uniref:hypothetical protein n=1 Tax=unclassified Bradyrhizobium TaxID=2631580 RepID=UPI001CD5055F|nr:MULTISPECIES: hypothetical protein [unclassified Bradyrhizobium]MCA1386036.1 hypothetical protein [Bradyrhizobium sp. BRP05]MCA1393834.1 hypothetical protein [Bradyrhizobium sp. IC3123]MCA1423478.1 hypothetical protein [Bradyrhizobium sp. BRP23]MCA1430628.1 hypothetical protein [Bradyrhizobium sp. NBAIM16]MCA1471205.1 hypothetical protein [Bradyrhizobium sp. IC3195]